MCTCETVHVHVQYRRVHAHKIGFLLNVTKPKSLKPIAIYIYIYKGRSKAPHSYAYRGTTSHDYKVNGKIVSN